MTVRARAARVFPTVDAGRQIGHQATLGAAKAAIVAKLTRERTNGAERACRGRPREA
ncbi:hypothetical protein [Paraburkholderia strydomiana]|uniref:hypothetical protein n=1 Tax=Paraburkholderia strydomiana TaxID=1245417 RepID=UPI001BEC0BEE|nr:hypothetical protein [Paraburkholderia strydomiana]MBT2790522.1 hypothetical protein [Paraburkholderia strydomiana]